MANEDLAQSKIMVSSSVDDYGAYRIRSPKEIQYILRGVMEQKGLVNGYFDRGRSFVLTAILAVDPEHEVLILDYGPDEALNQKLLTSGAVEFVTHHDRVKVQFAADRVEAMLFQGRPAFWVRLPVSLLKFQRREYFRLVTPIANPLKCTIPLAADQKTIANIADISLGGLGVVFAVADIGVEPGMVFHGCHFVLPDSGTIVASLEVRTVYTITLKNGAKLVRAGFRFVDLPANMQSMIQHYITRIERERRALQLERE